MRILGIETSCDETAVCVIDADGQGPDFRFEVLGNALISQTEVHAPYGGVFPNLAKREHEKNLVPLLFDALAQANLQHQGLTLAPGLPEILAREPELLRQLTDFLSTQGKPAIDAIAVTCGPGLEPALWVGINFAKALAAAWDVPIVPVNHMEGHIVLSAVTFESKVEQGESLLRGGLSKFQIPLLSLLISGGHTELVLSREWMQYEIIGQTRDDAVGEAFDKVARLLGLPYPGGPETSRLAAKARMSRRRLDMRLPRPMIDSENYDFSFSGLKTAVRRIVEANQPPASPDERASRGGLSDDLKMQIALEFENACADVLVAKTMRAIEEFSIETVLVGGGVSANTHIRKSLAQAIKDYGLGTKLLIPPPELATDNALMIALAGYFHALKNESAEPDLIRAQGNLKLS